jgi:outer membrane receptor protein involved in Fe transport
MLRIFSLLSLLLVTIAGFGQSIEAIVSGSVTDSENQDYLPFVNLVVLQASDSSFVTGTVANDAGRFTMPKIKTGNYILKASFIGYQDKHLDFHVGRLNSFLDLGNISLSPGSTMLEGITVSALRQEVLSSMDRKVYEIEENISQQGGSVAQIMKNLPGITVDQEGKVFLRGSDKVSILIDGKQTAITGMGSQSGLENIPASAIQSIEIINNPSAKYDASGMAGVINIIFKKERKQGWNGRAGLTLGAGALMEKNPNLVTIMRDQYSFTPKINPTFSLNYRKDVFNFFVSGDLLYHQQMMKNEFFLRTTNDGSMIRQQWLENRTQPIYNLRAGLDYEINSKNLLTFSALFNYRAYTDLGDLPYSNMLSSSMLSRFWQYYEEEINQTLFLSLTHKYLFDQPGHELVSSFNYSFRRKDEVFYFTNQNFAENFTGTDTTGLIADENIFDLTLDYQRPLRSGRIEIGTKQRARIFPNFITFTPGLNSILDMGLDGSAEYQDYLSALYTNYIYELKNLELEAGLRAEYARVDYLVDPDHSVYESSGFDYLGLFPNLRASWLINENSRLTAFYNRRVDRPEEKNLRVFPTYADPEIFSMGNPGLVPQFTNSFELGYRQSWDKGYIYGAAYHRISENILTKIITEVPGTTRFASVDQNAGMGYNTGVELVAARQMGQKIKLNANANYYLNRIAAFSIVNAYPSNITFSRNEQSAWAGNFKLNIDFDLPSNFKVQLAGIYFTPDIIPQGKILERYSVDLGISKSLWAGKGEAFLNATDLFNTMMKKYELEGSGFSINSTDYFETQVIRIGILYRF